MRWIFSEGIQVERINMDDPALKVISLNDKGIKLNTSFGIKTLTKKDFYWFRKAVFFFYFYFAKSIINTRC